MKWKELQLLADESLKKLREETEEKLRAWRFQAASGRLNNPRQIRQGKKLLARIQTLYKLRKKI